jgi:hypothetical protein
MEDGDGCENEMGDSLIVTFLNSDRFKLPNTILVYPNPVNAGSDLLIRCPEHIKGKIYIKMYTASGSEINATEIYNTHSNLNLKIGSLLPGIYSIRIFEKGINGSELLLEEKPIMVIHRPF